MFANLPRPRKTFIKVWIIAVATIYLLLGFLAVATVNNEKRTANENYRLRMDANAVEPGNTPPDPLPNNTDFTPVNIGVYLDGIESFSIKDSYWSATFYVWFRWVGDKSLDPGKAFQLVDGKIEKKELQVSYSGPQGVNYQSYKVVAKLTKFFNTTRVPLDDHMLNIYIQDSVRDVSKLRYVADPASNASSRIHVPGYDVTGFGTVVKPHTYKTSYGDPRMREDQRTTYSEYNFALTLQRAGVGVYLKLFIGLFAGVALAIGSFFIRPSDTSPRLAIPSAAYFGVIANTYLVHSQLPSSGEFGLADFVTAVGLLTISLCVCASLLSDHFFLRKEEREMSLAMDKVSWVVIGLGFLLVNIVLPTAALS